MSRVSTRSAVGIVVMRANRKRYPLPKPTRRNALEQVQILKGHIHAQSRHLLRVYADARVVLL